MNEQVLRRGIRNLQTPELWPEIERRIDGTLDVSATPGPARKRGPVLAAVAVAAVATAGSIALLWTSLGGGVATAPPPVWQEPLVIRLLSPGSDPANHTALPSAQVRFGAGVAGMQLDDIQGTWANDIVLTLPIVGWSTPIPAGAPIEIDSEADSFTVSIGPGPSRRGTPLEVNDGASTLPEEPGEYFLHVTGTWAQGRASFNIGIDLVTARNASHTMPFGDTRGDRLDPPPAGTPSLPIRRILAAAYEDYTPTTDASVTATFGLFSSEAGAHGTPLQQGVAAWVIQIGGQCVTGRLCNFEGRSTTRATVIVDSRDASRLQSSAVAPRATGNGPTDTPALGTLVLTQEFDPEGDVYFEGSLSFVRLESPEGTLFDVEIRDGRLERDVPSGDYTIRSYQRPCSGNCGSLDPPTDACEQPITVDPETVTRVDVVIRIGSGCRFGVPESVPDA